MTTWAQQTGAKEVEGVGEPGQRRVSAPDSPWSGPGAAGCPGQAPQNEPCS